MKKKIIAVLIFIGIAGGGFVWMRSKNAEAPTRSILATIQRGTINVFVSASGVIVAKNQIDLKTNGSGMITRIPVTAGDSVRAGQVLISLDAKDAFISLKQAQAGLESARANYQKVLSGASGPDIEVSRAAVISAQTSLDNAKKNLLDVKAQQNLLVKNSYHTFLNSGLMNSGVSSSGFGATPGPSNLSGTPPTISGTYTGEERGEYKISIYDAGGWRFLVSGLETADGTVNVNYPVPLGTKGLYIQFPSTIYNQDTWTIAIPNTRASNYLANQNSYQSALQNQTQAVHTAENSVQSAEASLIQSQAALSLKQAAARPEDVAIARAQIQNAEAQVLAAETALQNRTVVAPFYGRVGNIAVRVGQQIGPGDILAVLVADDFMAQVSLNEVDAANIKSGQRASLTFDAIPDFTLSGRVSDIDLVGSAVQGVVTYQTKISFDVSDARLKPGMSVTAAIITDSKADILEVPSTAVKTQNGQSFVEVVNASADQQAGTETNNRAIVLTQPTVRQNVTIGITNNQMTEIRGGLTEGTWVVTRTVQPTMATTQPTGNSAIRLPNFGGGGGGRR
ncbi:MAG: efflux RND transporter periplasmic adaptor subunit [Candidatus Uhrbacteria bacterium]|nr:efflux RND transporter periplasmic adaptor subunit [Candidatus Uhrbacteria bacterium]